MKHVVDAHALIWFLANTARLGRNADRTLSNPSSELVLPATALAEVCWIVAHRAVGLTIPEVMTVLDNDGRFTILPLDRIVIERSNLLHQIDEMHDRQIVATALLLMEGGQNVSLITNDQNITASELVPVTW